MTNFNHTIDDGAEDRLRSGEGFAHYSAWNFHGTVWFNSGKFKCKVMQHCNHVSTIESDSLQGIMDVACAKHGAG